MRTIIVDTDTVAYEAAASSQYAAEWMPDVWSVWGDLSKAKGHLKDRLLEIADKLQADRMVLALTDGTNWRKTIMPSYKANRAGVPKPILLRPLRDWLHEEFGENVYQVPGLEGDDVLGILATHPKMLKGQRIVVSIDKDLKTVPGWHLNTRDAPADGWLDALYKTTEAESDYYHMLQTLSGDPTDGYPGCPGIGPKTAAKILDPLWGDADDGRFFPVALAWPHVVKEYEKKGLSEEVALQNARVARICRASDYDFKAGKVLPWNPPTL